MATPNTSVLFSRLWTDISDEEEDEGREYGRKSEMTFPKGISIWLIIGVCVYVCRKKGDYISLN